ncbi:MAG: NAD-dependent epimerase/dehydratase family protein [Pseudomonadota bacterium]
MAILVTGVAGFIGHHVAAALLARGDDVVGIDNLNPYYDPSLKKARLAALSSSPQFTFMEGDVAKGGLDALPLAPDQIIHLAAQAGVRHSIENPQAYVHANLQGHANILEFARQHKIQKTIYASSSSVYGGNIKIPFAEEDRTDDPVSFYGATKKADELLSQSYARLYDLPLVGLRFFTVYGPWGRPDMAYWMFTENILKERPIRVFNQGRMGRDFTYIDDCVQGILAALDTPLHVAEGSPPHRVYNLGNDRPEDLMTFIMLLEKYIGKEAIKNFEPMQLGDVERTWADISRAREELGYSPQTPLAEGLEKFVRWFEHYFEYSPSK